MYNPGSSTEGVSASRAAVGGTEASKHERMEAKNFAGEVFEWSVLLGKHLGEWVGSAKQMDAWANQGTKYSIRLGFMLEKSCCALANREVPGCGQPSLPLP